MYSPTEKAYIWLDSFPLEGAFKRMLLKEAGSPVSLVKNFSRLLPLFTKHNRKGNYAEMEKTLLDGGKYFQNLLKILGEKGVTPIAYGSEFYPAEWEEFSDAPIVLYAKGNVELLRKRKFTVVGSRQTPEAVRVKTRAFTEELSRYFTIVTGFADGGDSAALSGALKTGNAISILSGGFLKPPKNNAPLLKKVAEHGLILSPFPMTAPTLPYSYVYRNKLLAALGEGTLVVSAGEKSGALITANYAEKAGKKRFAFPYAPGVFTGEGCNALIKNGATLVEEPKDVLTAFHIRKKEQTEKLKDELSLDESKIYELLKTQGELHISEISAKTGIPVFKLPAFLSALEVKGFIAKSGGNRFGPV